MDTTVYLLLRPFIPCLLTVNFPFLVQAAFFRLQVSLQVRFGLRTSKSERGAVAVDDATVMPGSCVKPGDCSFPSGSNGLCSWTRLVTDSIRMQWIKGHEEGFPANGESYCSTP